ncbi:heat-shock protein Hsp20 [Halobacteriales archaeon QS_8_69_26]|nr:MAG: heat-shock protein Hsp20 [Halobacteriales archaeon QS_8_69_26]
MQRNPFDEIEQMLERMSRQVEEGMSGRAGLGSIPVDVRDEGEEFVVTADLPGYEADDVDLTLSGKRLEITGEREFGYEEDADYVHRERRRSSVSRTVRLPEEVDPEAVEADLDDGVLTVHLPKAHTDEGHQIEIDE